MSEKTNQVMLTVDEIGKKWKGNGYADFKNNMRNKIQNIDNSLEDCNDLKRNLEEASRKMRMILEKLREKA